MPEPSSVREQSALEDMGEVILDRFGLSHVKSSSGEPLRHEGGGDNVGELYAVKYGVFSLHTADKLTVLSSLSSRYAKGYNGDDGWNGDVDLSLLIS